MSLRRTLVAALLIVAVTPSTARGADVRIVARDVPLDQSALGLRETAARAAPLSFDLVGLHWRGSGRVWFRTAARAGAWSPWQPARPEAEDLPDLGSAEGRAAAGWKLGNPYWTGPAGRIQYRLAGRVTRLRAYFISSPVVTSPTSASAARASAPSIIRRAAWGADESIVRAAPSYADRLRFAVVHHTAGTNNYTASQSAAIVRGIQRYHVLSNGWNDIGYSFLVDKYGQVFEGRGGGINRNVVGAHAQGFNTGSVGVSVLGTYEDAGIPTRARSALVKLLAWRLDVGHVDPLSALTFTSYGNDRFPAGTEVRLHAVSGHRDTGATSCPGRSLYAQLPGIAKAVAATGLPKLYDPWVSGALGQPVRFTARLSASAAWTVTVKDGAGAPVAQGAGAGTAVSWTWDSEAAPADRYTYVIAAGSATRPATGAVPGPPPLEVIGARALPAAITPNGDRNTDRLRVSFSLNLRSTVRVTVLASGAVVKTLLPDRTLAAGPVSVTWDGTRADGSAAPDRTYRVRIVATHDDQQVVRSLGVVVDRTIGSLTASPRAFSPNGDGRLDVVALGYELTRPADVRVHVLRGTTRVKRLFAGAVSTLGPQTFSWDGRLTDGRRAVDGAYRVRVQATTVLGTRILERRFQVDTTPPVLRVLSAKVVRGVTRIRFFLSEPAHVRIRYGTTSWREGEVITIERPSGEQAIWRRITARAIRLVAWDVAGNIGRRVVVRLG
jgi:flagellar hook assembly protein FlgD